MKQRLIFIRHGQTAANTKGLLHKKDSSEALNDAGREQVAQLIDVCVENHVEKIFTSSERRALETAEILAKGLGEKEVQVVGDLRERDWGDWEGKSWKDVEQVLDGMPLDKRYTFHPPRGESWQEMEQRLQRSLQLIIGENHASVAIVTHGGSLRAFMPILEKMPHEISLSYRFDNASVTIFDYEDHLFTKVLVNSTKQK